MALRALTADLIHEMQEILATKSRWTKKVAARDEHSRAVSPHDPRAVRYCLFGAARVCGAEIYRLDQLAEEFVAAHADVYTHPVYSASEFNDAPETNFAMVRAFLAYVKTRLREEENTLREEE